MRGREWTVYVDAQRYSIRARRLGCPLFFIYKSAKLGESPPHPSPVDAHVLPHPLKGERLLGVVEPLDFYAVRPWAVCRSRLRASAQVPVVLAETARRIVGASDVAASCTCGLQCVDDVPVGGHLCSHHAGDEPPAKRPLRQRGLRRRILYTVVVFKYLRSCRFRGATGGGGLSSEASV